jgi:5'-nucleotidase
MGQTKTAIQVLMTIGFSTASAVLGIGCTSNFTPKQANANGAHHDVTDVRPVETASTAAYQPPVYDTAPIPTAAVEPVTTPVVSITPSAKTIGEKTHTVRHGETLFSIAKATYGDGKKWKEIVAANPGVTPSKLKVGQVLVLPAAS